MKVILSAAISLDGHLDELAPSRLRLSSDEDWAEVKKLRAGCDAILVGAGTVRKDNPSLVIREEGLRAGRLNAGMDADIAKVTVSRGGNLDPQSRFFAEGEGKKIVFTSGPVSAGLERVADIVVMPEITARGICAELESRGYCTLMVEGGSSILTMFLEEDAADELRLAIAPFFVGQQAAPRLVNAGNFAAGKNNRMKPEKVELLGDTTVIHLVRR